MPNIFHYEGRDVDGNAVNGNVDVNTVEDVVVYLKKYNIIPINIYPVKQNTFKLSNILSLSTLLHKVAPHHTMNFFRQLAILIDAGLPLIKAISKLSESSNSRNLSVVLAQVANDIAAGLSLSESLKKHPEVFLPLMINVIDVGENTGHLGESLRYLSSYIETAIANRRRLLSAIRYPMFVIITMIVAIIIVNFFVIPKFSMIFSKLKLNLPLATRVIVGLSDFLVKNSKILIAVAIVAAFTISRLLKVPGVRYIWDKYVLRFPIFGNLQRRIIISQFTWTFSLILRSGVPIIKGLALASSATANTYFSANLLKIGTAIEQGENLSRAAINSNLFTPITIQMIEVGEESEKLDDALIEVAKYYDAEIDYDLRRLSEMIEPILLTMIGGLMLVLAIGVYFPLWDLIKTANIY